MTRQRNKSKFVSTAGIMLEIFSVLQKHGVTDADWRRVLADNAHAAWVAAALRNSDGSFASLLAAGGFDGVNEYITDARYADRWDTKGTRVRGPFHVIDMSADYTTADLATAIEEESGRASAGR